MAATKKHTNFMETRPQKEIQEKIQAAMEREGLDALLLTTPENIMYSTGWCTPLYNWRQTGTAMAVVPKHGKASIIVSQFEQGGPVQQTKDVDIVSYPVWIFIEDFYDPNEKTKDVQPDMYRTFRMAMDIIKEKTGADKPKVGIELGYMPHDKYLFLEEAFGADNLKNISDMMIKVRTIKLPWEIDILRYAAKVIEKMMGLTMLMTEPGMTEADIYKLWWQSAYEITGGHDIVSVSQAHTPGPDFWAGYMARERELREGDIVRIDGGVSLYGYISDLGRSYCIGDKVPEKSQAIFDTLLAAHDAEVAMMQPGNKLKDAFHAAMEVCHKGALPHFVRGHFGHTLGMGPGEEYPMLDPNNELVMEPGMVFCCETPYYSSKFGSFNIEDTLVITESGHERFTHTNRSLIVGMK